MEVREQCKGLEMRVRVRIYLSVRKESRVPAMRWWGRVRMAARVMVGVGC